MKRVFKNKGLLIFLLLIFVGLLSACGNDGQSANNNAGNGGGQNQNRQFQQPDVYGEIKEISGNKVTLSLLEMPQFNRNRNNNNGQNQQSPEPAGSPNPSGNSNRPRPSGGFNMQKNYTGETKTIDLPDNVKITAFQRGNGNNQQTELKVSDLKKGDILQIYYNKDNKNEIDNIRAIQTSSN